MLVIKTNSLKEENEREYKNWKEIYIETKNINQYYDVKEPSNENNGLIVLAPDSIGTKFKCRDLGTAHDYDSRI